MNIWAMVGIAAAAVVASAVVVGLITHSSAMSRAEQAYAHVAARPPAPVARFDPQQVAILPEIAERYFRHAIAPGTPLYSVVELEMEGTFLLGSKGDLQTYDMSARQALRPPNQFVWISKMRSGAITIIGSDALVDGEAWTRFWLFGLAPVAQQHTSHDLVRSAQFRAAVEGALWLPSSLLPENGVVWEQLGANTARVSFQMFRPEIALQMTLDNSGAVREVVGERWSNANPEGVFRLQPFGGTMLAEESFQGFTIPSQVRVGNHYGTAEYLAFFQARITSARYR